MAIQTIPMYISESFQGSSSTTLVVKSAEGVSVVNRGAEDMSITINDVEITVKPDETFMGCFVKFESIIVNATDNYALVTMRRF